MEYLVKVGLLTIGINVYFSDDCKAKYYSLPLSINSNKGMHQPSYEERSKSLIRGKPPVGQVVTDRYIEETRNSNVFIQELEEKIIELNRKIISMEEIKEMEELMNNSIENAGKIRIDELESIIDSQRFEIELLKNQNSTYLLGKSPINNHDFKVYTDKAHQLTKKEIQLKNEFEKLELQHQKIIKKNLELSCIEQTLKENMEKNLETCNQSDLLSQKIDIASEIKPCSVDIFSQTSPEKQINSKESEINHKAPSLNHKKYDISLLKIQTEADEIDNETLYENMIASSCKNLNFKEKLSKKSD